MDFASYRSASESMDSFGMNMFDEWEDETFQKTKSKAGPDLA